ncbi:metallophosphoesterase [Polaribacter glomeratus]|uniref:Phosphoesterase n=1 Tax=Polaribacter glomeratus TaxID=102 RepID=A0A2S7X060_9FLAO|nr:metallophosphoesterase [Polaribacter glomeratus]PQJ83012.1 phosphoesterase [Polaribacter glomeratus]TXD64279.1 phosphoesterase [Polaribacter glomeratus]
MKKFIFLVLLLVLIISCSKKTYSSFKIGIIADCQYCDCEVKWDRYYKKSPQRLKEAIAILNKDSLNYTIHLGDFIDQKMSSLDSILPTWNSLKSTSYHVLGNHDFDVSEAHKEKIIEKLNLKDRYYSFVERDWRFIVLDGNDLSFYGTTSELKKQQTDSLFNSLENKNLPYLKKWNGGLSNTQLNWIRSELNKAVQENQKVGFYCHFPIFPIDQHTIWNREQFLSLIKPYKNVKLFFNGHNHAGAYQLVDNVHYLTFKGMVDTEKTSAFAKVKFDKDTVFVEGFHREISRKLIIK